MAKLPNVRKLWKFGGVVFIILSLFVIRRQYNTLLGATKFFKQVETPPTTRANSNASSQTCFKPLKATTHIICSALPFAKPTCQSDDEGDADCPGCVVPNIVHFVWLQQRSFLFFHYLSVLSVAINHKPKKILFHTDVIPEGPLWSKVIAEVPCFEVVDLKPPTHVFGKKIANVVHQTDVVRIELLLANGGIYLDSDVIVLKSLNPLRNYSYTMGRIKPKQLNTGAFLAKPNAPFLQAVHQAFKNYGKQKRYLYLDVPHILWRRRPDLPIHVEESSMHRPSPFLEDEHCLSPDSYDISNNYMLHLHPKQMFKYDPETANYGIEELRIGDTTYGAAARAALFGTQDLVFLEGEEGIARDRKTPKPVPPLKD